MEDINWLLQLGPYSILIIFAGYIIWKEFFSKKNNSPCNNKITLERMEKKISRIVDQTDDLYNWHNKEDSEGVKIWYVRKSLEEAILQLSINIATQTEILRELVTTVKKTDDDVRTIKKKVDV